MQMITEDNVSTRCLVDDINSLVEKVVNSVKSQDEAVKKQAVVLEKIEETSTLQKEILSGELLTQFNKLNLGVAALGTAVVDKVNFLEERSRIHRKAVAAHCHVIETAYERYDANKKKFTETVNTDLKKVNELKMEHFFVNKVFWIRYAAVFHFLGALTVYILNYFFK